MVGDGLAPEGSMARSSARDDPKTASRTWAQGGDRSRPHHGGVDFIFCTIAVDGSAGSASDDCSNALLHGSRYELVDKGVFQGVKGPMPSLGQCDQPVWIFASGMGNRQENRDMGRRRMDVRR